MFPPSASDHISFAGSTSKRDISLPPYSPGSISGKLHKAQSVSVMDPESQDGVFEFERKPAFLRKASIGFGKRTREAIKFRPLAVEELSSDSEDERDLKSKPLSPLRRTGFVLQKTPSTGSGTTAVDEIDVEKEKKGIAKALARDAPEYSDYEEDVTVSVEKERMEREKERGQPGWSPQFIRRASLNSSASGSKDGSKRSDSTAVAPAGAVPMTPSLIKALDRISAAQHAVYGPNEPSTPVADEGLPNPQPDKGARWEAFWRDVKAKAGQEKR